MIDLSQVTWRKASASGPTGGNCVEVATRLPGGAHVAVRDSKAPEGGAHVITRAAFARFLAAAKSGQYDLN